MSCYLWRFSIFILIINLINKLRGYNFKVDNNSTSSKELSTFVNFENGDYMIIYENSFQGNYALKVKKYNYENVIFFETQLNPSKTSFVNEFNPKALNLFNDTFVLIWQSQNLLDNFATSLEGNLNLNAQIFNKNFIPINKQFKISESKTNLISNKSVIKISNFLFAVVYSEYIRNTKSYLLNYNILSVNGIIIKNEKFLNIQEKIELNINYLNETTFFISYLTNEIQMNYFSKEKSPNKILNITYINHNAAEFDKYITDKKFQSDIFNSNFSSIISNFNFVFSKMTKNFSFKKYTTTNNYNILNFPKSKILFYNSPNSTNNNSYNNVNSTLNNNVTSNNANINNSNYSLSVNTTTNNNLIGIISSYDNTSNSYNGFTLLNLKNNSYIQFDILDSEFNFLLTKYYKLDNGCCFDSSVLSDGSFIVTWQYFFNSSYNSSYLTGIAYAEFGFDLSLKFQNNQEKRFILPQMDNQIKLKPRIYKFEKTKNNLYDKKLLVAFNTAKPLLEIKYDFFISSLDCSNYKCEDEYIILNSCSKNCKSCIANPFVCSKCSPTYYPLYGGIISDQNFDFLNPNKNISNINYSMNSTSDNYSINYYDNNYISLNNHNNLFNCFQMENPPTNSYLDSANMVYFKCDDSCDGCKNTTQECLNCNTQLNYYPLEDKKSKCVLDTYDYDFETNQGYYLELKSLTMKKCNFECKTCIYSAGKCTECNNDGGYYSISSSAMNCQKNPKGFYLDSINKIYKKCIDNCLNCQDNLSCVICDDYSTLSSDRKKCYFCGEGMYFDEIRRSCRDCGEIGYCRSCNAFGCFQCRDHFEFKAILSNTSLINQVNTKIYENIIGTCNTCNFGYLLISNNCESILIIVIPIAILIFLVFLVILLVIKLRKKNGPVLPNLNSIIHPNPHLNNRNRRIISRIQSRQLKKLEQDTLNTLQPINDLHDTKCLFGDNNPPFWLFDCGGYMCNQCSFKIVADIVKEKHKCPKCEQELKNFRYLNRYSSVTPNEQNNTIINLDDVNISEIDDSNKQEIELPIIDEKNKNGNNQGNEISDTSKRNLKKEDSFNKRNSKKKNENIIQETCQICFVLRVTKKIDCESSTKHMLCNYCYNRMLKIDKVKVCPFCRTKINII